MFLCICLGLIVDSVSAQNTYKMGNAKVYVCKGKLTDSEGNTQSVKKYANNENYTFTVCVKGSSTINIKFNGTFCTESISDYLKVYKGSDTTGTLIRTYSGFVTAPIAINAADTCITFFFHSDANIVCDGWDLDWEAKITSVPQPKFSALPDPTCNSNKIRVTLDQKFNCDSVKASNFKLGGALNTGIASVVGVNCDSKNETGTFDVTFNSGLNKSGNYTLDFNSSFKDACDSVWKINAKLNFKITDCPIKVDLKSDKNIICNGSCAILNSTVTGGNASNYVFTWLSPVGMSTGATPRTICPTQDTRYILRVSDGVSLPGYDTLDIMVVNPPVGQNDTLVCQNSAPFQLTAAPAGGTWSGKGIANSANGTFSPALSGSGTFMVYYAIGTCLDSVKVTVRAINPGPPNAACPSSSPFFVSNFSPPGGTWSGPNITTAGLITPPSTSGSFVVQYTWNGCVGNKTINIDGINIRQFDTLCQSVAADTFKFSPKGGTWSGPNVLNSTLGTNNPNLAGAGNKRYIYSINGCKDTLNRTILAVDARWDEIACPDASNYTLPAGLPVGGYWSGKGILDPINGTFAPDSFSVPGKSTFVQTDLTYHANNGCKDVKIMYIRYTRFYADTINNCFSDTAYFMRYQYLYNDPWNMFFTGSTGIIGNGIYNQKFSPAAAGRGSINTIIGDANGCKDTIVIRVYPRANIQRDTVLCIADDPIQLFNGEKKGLFSGPGITNSALGTFNPVLAGIGSHQILFQLPGKCTDTVNIKVNGLPIVSINGLLTTYCFKDTVIPIILSPRGGILTGMGLTDTVFNPVNTGTGNHTFKYKYGSGKCISTVTHDLTIADTLKVTLKADQDTICIGIPVNLNSKSEGGTGTYRMDWNNGAYNVQSIYDVPKQSKTYRVVLRDGCSDSSFAEWKVFVHPPMFSHIVSSPIQCYGNKGTATVNMMGTGPFAYEWNSTPRQTGSTITASVGTTYKVKVKNTTTGCLYDTSAEIPGYPRIRAYFTISPAGQCIYSNNANVQIIDLSEGGSSGTWDFGDQTTVNYLAGTNPNHTYSGDTDAYTITLRISNSGNCSDSFKLPVCVLDTVTLFIPSAFTPNDDGSNDVFGISTGSVSNVSIEVYNRWGEKIFQTFDPKGVWDGTYKGNPCPTDYYIYVIKYKGKKTPWKYKKGYFYLIR